MNDVAVFAPPRDSPDGAPLAGITVLELDAGYASYAGKILTDFGARVINVEPPGGAAQRRAAPLYRARDGQDGRTRSPCRPDWTRRRAT